MLFSRFYNWLASRFSARSRRNSDRLIFRFWDGQRDRAADPSILVRLIENDPELNLERDGALIEANDDEATGNAVRCVHRAFNVKEFSQGGLLEAECLQLLESFILFCDALKKNTSDSPISSEPTASDTSTASTDPAPTPSKSSSDSNSMPSVPS